MDRQMIKDKKLSQQEGVVNENKNIYQLDLDNEGIIEEEIDAEVNDLTEYGGEDDNSEYGDYDEGY